jgi:hypothetical protein
VQGKGEGQGSCDICNSNGIWNRHWMVMLYKDVETGLYYCRSCLDKLEDYEILDKEE